MPLVIYLMIWEAGLQARTFHWISAQIESCSAIYNFEVRTAIFVMRLKTIAQAEVSCSV